ncbi:hypothetical protein ACSBR9_24365, partial [Xanthomonas campestris]
MNVLVAALLCALAGTAVAQDIPPGYAGQGGVALQDIGPAIYADHYGHGFTRGDGMGRGPALQVAWSR